MLSLTKQLRAIEETGRDNEEKETLYDKNVWEILKWNEEHFQLIFREIKVKTSVQSTGALQWWSVFVDMTRLTICCTARISRSAPAPGQHTSSVSTMSSQTRPLQSTVSTGRFVRPSTARRENSSSTPVCPSSWSGTPSRDSSQHIWWRRPSKHLENILSLF